MVKALIEDKEKECSLILKEIKCEIMVAEALDFKDKLL